ncbi:MAG: hypothetical protein HYT87_12780 [Nitrospirae bacterium]|nr:hypothetical protein [Nitrospirota bacterium]
MRSRRGRSSLSGAKSYREIGEFWDTHDLSDYWPNTKPVSIDVDIQSETTYCALDERLSRQVQQLARRRGMSSTFLINRWVKEKLQAEKRTPSR